MDAFACLSSFLPPATPSVEKCHDAFHKSLVFYAWGITCIIALGTTPETTRHRVMGMQVNAAMRCQLLMAASVLRTFREYDAADIREKGRATYTDTRALDLATLALTRALPPRRGLQESRRRET